MKYLVSCLCSLLPLAGFSQVFLDSLLSNGLDERTHQLYSNKERRSLDLDRYDNSWVITIGGAGDFVVDGQSMLALFNNDFYEFYHNATLDFSSPLKKKKFEQSEEFAEWKDEMQMQRDFVIDDTLHMPLEEVYREPLTYDIDKGRFIISPYHPSIYGNGTFIIPTSLSKFFVNPRLSYDFYCNIANEDIALSMENTDRYDNHKYDFLIRFRYLEKPPTPSATSRTNSNRNRQQIISSDSSNKVFFEIVDIILYKTSNKQVVWSMLLGDLSQTVN